MKKNIIILFGGCSSEYDISLQSAYAVLTHINSEKYNPIAVGITKDGTWFRYDGDYALVQSDQWLDDQQNCTPAFLSPDRATHGLVEMKNGQMDYTYAHAVFPVLHGKNGEDGTIQGLAELAGIPVIGCNTLSSALCMDKYRAHRIVKAAGVSAPDCILLTKMPGAEELFDQIQELSYPLFVKPLKAGSSLGITKVGEQGQLMDAVKSAFAFDDQVTIEESVEGFEVGCAILGNDLLTVGRVDEIQLSDGFFDYEEKYHRNTAEIHMPARIDQETENRIRDCAKVIYKALGCSGFARVDMFLTPTGDIVFNEVNTIPGLTCHSRYPKMLAGIGISFNGIIDMLLDMRVPA